MSSGNGRLSLKEKIGYAVGDTASNIYFQTFQYFILFFYTDVVGLTAASVATMFAVSRIWDAINDPVMGTIADRTNTRWGKFRPYLLWVAVPFGLLGALCFTTPGFETYGAKIIYAYITYNLLMMAYTAINVPYAALMGVITPNSLERTVLASFRFVGVFAGAFIVQGATLPMVRYFGQGDPAKGWQWAMTILSAVAVALFFVTFSTTRERVPPPPGQKGALRRDLKDLLTSRPWLLIATATFVQLFFIVARNSTVVYYFKYYVKDQDLDLFGRVVPLSFETLSSSFLLTGTVFTILGAMSTSWFGRRMDKGKAYAGFLAVSAISAALFYFLQPHNVILMYVLNIVMQFAWGPVSALQWSIYTDCADHLEWKTRRRATGLLMAGSLFSLKLGLAVGGWFTAWILEYYGFVANQEQTSETLTGIVLLMSLYPAVVGILGTFLMFFYPLTNKAMVQIEQDLKARRSEIPATGSGLTAAGARSAES
jgi:glycoside/pentoside/hexuronide:cation symporter, GPH family